MRPMTATSANYLTGAFAPARIDRKPADTRLREDATRMHLVKSNLGDGKPSPAFGSFIDYAKTKYGVNRFFKTQPANMLPLYPVMPRYNKQVQNPAKLTKQPGYTNTLNLNPVQTKLQRMILKPYPNGSQNG